MTHWKAKQSCTDLINEDGRLMSAEIAHEKIRQSIQRTGKFIMGSPIKPEVGEIAYFAGLPMRVVRFVSWQEADADWIATQDIWGYEDGTVQTEDFFFVVVVAD